MNALIWRDFRPEVNAARAVVCGLPPRRTAWTGHSVLYGISPGLVSRLVDWPPTGQICGHWLPPLTDWSPPAALGEFLEAGEPPIYVGFGSMGLFCNTLMVREVLAALRGQRALFYAGWGALGAAALPPNVHALTEVPHSSLFLRVALDIHHGGAGTTHATVRAGIPSVIVPFAGDQFFWADRLRDVGCAPEPVPARGLSAGRLANAIHEARKGDACASATLLARSNDARERLENGCQGN